MNCDGVRGLLSAYLDGELSPGELLRVEQHLRRCHCCADEVDVLRQTIALVKSLDEVEVPATFRASLHDRLVALGPPMAARKVPAARPWQRHLRTWAIPAAAAAAVLAVGMGQINQLGSVNPGDLVQTTVDIVRPSADTGKPPVTSTQPAPVNGGQQKDPTGTAQPPQQTTTPANPPTQSNTPPKDNGTGGPEATTTVTAQPAPKGQLSSVLQGYTVSLLDTLTRPDSLPAKVATSHSLSLKVADAAEMVGKLKAAYPQAAEVAAVGQADVLARLDITVPVQEAEAALANIRQVLGQNVAQEPASSADLASSIALSFKRLTDLESQRDRTITRAEDLTAPAQISVIKQELDEIVLRFKAEREQYENMQAMVSTVTIRVYLTK